MWSFRRAVPADWPRVRELLIAADLPLEGAEEHLSGYLLAFSGERLAGVGALERYEDTALLRSVAVSGEERGQGLGQALVTNLLEQARADGISRIALLTTTAERFFPRFGFRQVEWSEVPESVRSSTEFRGACPTSAVAMLLDLASPVTER